MSKIEKLYVASAWILDDNDEVVPMPELRVTLSQYLSPEEYFLDDHPSHKDCLVFLKTAEAAEKVNAAFNADGIEIADGVFRHPAEEMAMWKVIDHLECRVDGEKWEC